MKARTAFIAGASGVVAAITGFGYWHAATHATLNVHLAYRSGFDTQNPASDGHIEFLDSNGAALARALIDAKRNVVWLTHPEKGQCGPTLAPSEYLECFRAQSEWIPGWVQRVRYANVTVGRCTSARQPASVAGYRGNLLLWWVPLPHVGGLPYTNYSVALAAGNRHCK